MDIMKVAVSELNAYPNNPRKGDVKLIAESLETYGQYKPITVNRNGNVVLAGNHTLQAAKHLGWAEIEVTFVDVDDATAAKIVAIDNKTSDMGGYDTEKLLELLDELPDLKHTGYTQDEVDSLIALLDEETTPTIELGHSVNAAPRVGETGISNVDMKSKLRDEVERYASMTARSFLLYYENAKFVWVADKLLKYREEHNLASNADALIKMLEDISGEEAPK